MSLSLCSPRLVFFVKLSYCKASTRHRRPMTPPKTVAERLAQQLAEIDALPVSVLPATRLGLKHQANPRQFRFHPNGKWAYIANESGPGCTMLRYDAQRGTFEEDRTGRTVPESYREPMTCAEVEAHPSGEFVGQNGSFVAGKGICSRSVGEMVFTWCRVPSLPAT